MASANPQPRNDAERRSGFDRRNLAEHEAEALRCCQLAGAIFKGIQQGYGILPALCLFQKNQVDTTLCVAMPDLTPMRITERLAESERTKTQHAARPMFAMKFPATTTGEQRHNRTA